MLIRQQDATRPALNNLMPDVHGEAAVIIPLFEDKTIGGHDLVALLGAHTAAKQFFVDPAHSGAPLDTTPGVWDVSFYQETLQAKAAPHTFRFHSDISISQEPFENIEWTMFSGNQTHWNNVSTYPVSWPWPGKCL